MNYLVLLAIVSGICSILSFLVGLYFSTQSKSKRWIWFIILLLLSLASSFAVYYNSELERVRDIHKQAKAISEHYRGSSYNKEFIQESLTFLEENKDRYSDAYERAKNIYEDMRCSDTRHDYEPAMEIHGIIKGIATMNE